MLDLTFHDLAFLKALRIAVPEEPELATRAEIDICLKRMTMEEMELARRTWAKKYD